MERRDARLFQQDATSNEGWNIVELESHRQFRQKVNELIQLTTITGVTTNELQQELRQCRENYGPRFATQLVRALHQDDEQERQAIVALLILLYDLNTISPLQQLSRNQRCSRATRLSASFALAGMGVTGEQTEDPRPVRLYAIS